jgi:hypothetical protein
MCLQAISSKDLYPKSTVSYSITCYRHNCSLLVNKFLDYKKKNVGNNALHPDVKPLRLLAYADDLLIFLPKPIDWQQLNDVLEIYHKASNAKVTWRKQTCFQWLVTSYHNGRPW